VKITDKTEIFDANVLIGLQLVIEENSNVSWANVGLPAYIFKLTDTNKETQNCCCVQQERYGLILNRDAKKGIFTNFNEFLMGKIREFLLILKR